MTLMQMCIPIIYANYHSENLYMLIPSTFVMVGPRVICTEINDTSPKKFYLLISER